MSKIKLFSNCIPVKGYNRSVICDTQRNQVKLIPNSLYNILSNYQSHSTNQIKKLYDNKFNSTIDEYIEFLLENELIFFTDTPENFPKLNLDWHTPFQITNAIIDFDKESSYNIKEVICQLDDLNCKHIELRLFNISPKSVTENVLQLLKKIRSIIYSVNIICDSKYESVKFWVNLMKNYTRAHNVILHSSEKHEQINPFPERNIITTDKKINSKNNCGVISIRYFAVNIKNFTESKYYNSCLNRKISIDVNGDIKNCPSIPQNFGNIKGTTLEEAMNHKDFKKYWNITKDEIEICKDCEFRYVCTDCRAYIEKPENIYSKPLKCGYSPYTNKWEEWSTNPLKQKTIEHYGMLELVKKDV